VPLLHDPQFRSAIEARLSALRPGTPHTWGKMTVDQMLWHVNEFLAAAIGEGTLPVRKNSMPLLRPLMRIMLLYGPWPKSVPTNPGAVAHGEHDFEAEKGRCRALIAKFVSRPIDGPWPVDPTFGAATGKFASRLQARHLDHHLRQFGV
jgi:hypothetical protein